MDRRQQMAAAAERYRETSRREMQRRQQAKGTPVVDTPSGLGPGSSAGGRSNQAATTCDHYRPFPMAERWAPWGQRIDPGVIRVRA
jgi:hypothetical protein